MNPLLPPPVRQSLCRWVFLCACLMWALALTSCSGCNGKNGGDSTRDDGNSASSAAHYERNDGKHRVIVFVHGIYGSAAGTWKCEKTGNTWPRMLLSDHSFDTADVYVAQYPTHFSGNLMSIDDQVSNLMNRLEGDKVFSGHDEVVFVAHSMGGLIVQRLLLTHHDLAPKVRFIYFLSTPQEGAAIARLGHALNGDPNLQQMFPGDSNTYLQNIEAEWMGANFGIPRYCTIERKAMHGVLVVDRESGTRNCQKVVALDEDHAGVAKPCSTNDDSYIALRVAEEANPVLRAETTTRDWRSYQAVDCNHTNSNVLEASVSLDPTYHERVTDKPTARYEGSDHIKDANPNPPAVLSYQGNTAKVQYGFNGEDAGTFGCPGGGHTTIVVTFPIERKVPAQ
jgi:pimeloyl-ACP methyl ester carboxylesterase